MSVCVLGIEQRRRAEGEGGRLENWVPFFMAFAFSALRAACAGLTDFSLGILKGCEEMWSGRQGKASMDVVVKLLELEDCAACHRLGWRQALAWQVSLFQHQKLLVAGLVKCMKS